MNIFKKYLYAKILIGYIIFAIISLSYISINQETTIKDKQLSSHALFLYNKVNGISHYYSNTNYNIYNDTNVHDYNEEIKTFMLPKNTTIWIISNTGMILYSSNTNQIGYTIDITKYFNETYYTRTTFNEILEKEAVAVYSPIVHEYKTYGYVIMFSDSQSVVDNYVPLSNFIYGEFLFITALSFVLLIPFHFFVYRPVRKIEKASIEYAKGNFDYKDLKIKSEDELSDIAHKLNFIAKEMKETDNNQKKFISNISHDFRSPLTSIKGYIEAMLDGTIPPELHEKYLKVLLFETERLNKLTESLLTLNTWDVKGSKLECTEFDLVPLMRNILASFEGQCINKKITFDVFLGDKSYMVNADQTKIQQVIYNLIDNAIKFSNQNSTIHIRITDKNEKVFISVKDMGIGIPKESLSKIWDRFYKTDLSRGKDKTGSGLGLSIVKEIIVSHGENINVISTEGAGTEFVFTLQKSKKSLLPLVPS